MPFSVITWPGGILDSYKIENFENIIKLKSLFLLASGVRFDNGMVENSERVRVFVCISNMDHFEFEFHGDRKSTRLTPVT